MGETLAYELTKGLHSTFLESMEARYKEILTFFGFVLPALTGFTLLLFRYKEAKCPESMVGAFLVGTGAVVTVLFWGATYALAVSYRYRYLQASVYFIEESCSVSFYVPDAFKPKAIHGVKARLLFSFVPGILQVHVFFLLGSTLAVTIGAYGLIEWAWQGVVLVCFWVVGFLAIVALGTFYYPRKLNRIVANLDQRTPKARRGHRSC